ncbi:hypothetical protein PMG11_04661 [Penicillium brasilianum]|uniref:GPI anchored protein n=1 Tax=Penicillium brasilianum TaxID=104259 RepID=A0A0F7VJJ7_PENBI|nr:hypothetical protein PMG11_04661 [Penicillium brasilianum]
MVKFAKQLGISLLLLFSAVVAEETIADEPQQLYNTSLHISQEGILNTRDLFGLEPRAYTCRSGYSECAYDTSRCCPSGTSCCGTGYCADPGDTCCTTGGTCPSGWNCCGDACSPVDGECCNGGYYCRAGKHCRIYNGEKVCCPSSGCSGESDSGSLGGTVTAVATVTATTTSRTTSTYQRTYADYSYYSTTYYWTFYYYFWTSFAPYTVQTVTSTITTTTTILSVYVTDSAEASFSFSSKIRSLSSDVPYSATSLKGSTNPVTIHTGVSAPTSGSSSSISGGQTGANAASTQWANRLRVFMCGILNGTVIL